ncbi:MAG: hypothetical protein VKP57_00420 [Candidatus Sericytochromatia bacterium]|nr:hypothetical protein [Candidatus Sericytochromatia bacterium]
MIRLARLVVVAIVVMALLGVRNADSVCPRVCLHQGLAHPCSWSVAAEPDQVDAPDQAHAFLAVDLPSLEDATLPPTRRVAEVRHADGRAPKAWPDCCLPRLVTSPPVPPPRFRNA